MGWGKLRWWEGHPRALERPTTPRTVAHSRVAVEPGDRLIVKLDGQTMIDGPIMQMRLAARYAGPTAPDDGTAAVELTLIRKVPS